MVLSPQWIPENVNSKVSVELTLVAMKKIHLVVIGEQKRKQRHESFLPPCAFYVD